MLSVCFFTLVILQSTFAESPILELPGVCHVPRVEKKYRYVYNGNKTWTTEMYNVTRQDKECCSGYKIEKPEPLSCSPICDPPCTNSDCMGPNTCVCHPGHVMDNNSNNSCYEICDSCVNGHCPSPNDTECTCFQGYEPLLNYSHICMPRCSPGCVNALCTAPGHCECVYGHKPEPDETLNNICIPHCTKFCVFGKCTDPDICTCYEGYINDEDAPNICLPVCNNTCVNGDCSAPDVCECWEGFELDPRSKYRCVSQSPSCKLTIPQAMKYDQDSDCFIIKEKIIASVPPQCRVIQSHSGSLCSPPDSCHHNACELNFQCYAVILNGLHEFHCNSEEDGLKTENMNIDHVTNVTEWTDIVLVLNSDSNINSFSSAEIKGNITKEWTLQPLSKSPVCGRMVFTVKITNCEISTLPNQENDHINSSFMFWLNMFVIFGFLLLVGAGVGGFLWARHRRLNDPLNYRDDMMQGYYPNECYDTHPELVSDDDSLHDSDAPL